MQPALVFIAGKPAPTGFALALKLMRYLWELALLAMGRKAPPKTGLKSQLECPSSPDAARDAT